jgi:hypothetical protein
MRLHSAGLPLFVVALFGSGRAAADQCSFVNSRLVSTLFVEGCTSPVGFCTRGTVAKGRLAGTFEFTAMTSEQPDPTSPLMFYTGMVVYTTKKGTVSVTDSGVFNALNGAFFEVQTVVSKRKKGKLTSQGLGIFAQMGGAMQLVGFKGSVAGRICGPDRHGDDDEHESEHDNDNENEHEHEEAEASVLHRDDGSVD